MWPLGVVLADVLLQSLLQLPGRMVLIDVDFLRLQAAEPTFNHDVVCPAGLPVLALTDVKVLKKLFILLTALLLVELMVMLLKVILHKVISLGK